MTNLYLAEYRKASGNRCLVGCTIWIYPLFGLGLFTLFFLLLAFNKEFRTTAQTDWVGWDSWLILPWVLPTEQSGIFRLPILAFIATMFASEYQYQTWKNILPPNRRWAVLLAKTAAIFGFICTGFLVTSLVLVVGFGLLSVMFNLDYNPTLTGDHIMTALGDFLPRAGLTLVLLLILSCFAALQAIRFRSIMMSAVGTIIFSLTESIGVLIPVAIAVELLKADWFAYFYLFTPTYNINNILFQMDNSGVLEAFGKEFSMTTSILVLVTWVVSLSGLTLFFFQRQDIQ